MEAYRASLEVLQIFLVGGSSLESRHQRLTYHAPLGVKVGTETLAVDGAACAIGFGQIETALEILEQGRSFLLTQAGRYRTHVDDLEATHPKLAHKFQRLSAKMETSSMSTVPQDSDAPLPGVEDAVALYVTFRHSTIIFSEPGVTVIRSF